MTQGAPGDEEAVVGGMGPAGALARELRQKVFELEGQVHDLEGKVVVAEEARLAAVEHGGGGGGGGGGGNGIGAYLCRRVDWLAGWVLGSLVDLSMCLLVMGTVEDVSRQHFHPLTDSCFAWHTMVVF